MGYDAYVHINKKYTKATIEKLLLMLGYEKRKDFFIVAMMMNISILQVSRFGCAMKIKRRGYIVSDVQSLR